MKRILTCLAIGQIFGIIAGRYMSLGFFVPILLFLALVTFVFAVYRKRKNSDYIFILKIVAAILFSSIIAFSQISFLNNNESQIKEKYFNREFVISGMVKSPIRSSEFYHSFDFDIRNEEFKFTVQVSVKRNLKNGNNEESITALKYGDNIALKGTIENPEQKRNPDDLDIEEYLRQNGILGTVTITADQIYFADLPTNSGNAIIGASMAVRSRINNFFDSCGLKSYDEAMLLKGVLIGDKSGISKDIQDDFSDAGLTHLLTVSGTPVTYVALLFIFIFRALRLSKRTCNILAVIALILFIFITGFTPPVVRAVIMASSALTALVLRREHDTYVAISLASVIILATNPYLLFNAGFQLSFVATLSILLFYRVINNKILAIYTKRRKHAPKKITGLILSGIALTISVQLGITPLCTIYFNKITLIGIVTNLAAMPLIPILSYAGYFMLIVIFIFQQFGNFIFEILKAPTNWLISISRIASDAGVGIIQTEGFSIWVTAIYYGILIYIFKLRKVKHSKKIAAILALTMAIAITINISSASTKKLEIVFLDVGQGDCIFIKSEDGKNILVDVGEKAEPVLSYLKYRGIGTIDLLFATHEHADHIGALGEVKNSINIKKIIGTAAAGGELVCDNTKINVGNDLEFEVHNPPTKGIEELSANNKSLMLKMKFKNFSLVLSGDCEKEAEALVEQSGEDLSANVIKVGHHGSATSSTADFLMRVKPTIAVVSVGENNLYGHPANDTLTRLQNVGAKIYRTDKNGAVMIDTDGSKIFVNVMIK